jgi:hypothetical protein
VQNNQLWEVIAEALRRGRNAMAIWQDLVDAHGFTGRYASARRFVVKPRGLQPVYAKALIDTNNLEAVFAAFEMAKLFGQLNGLERSEVEALPGAIRKLIVRTLEWTIQFPVFGNQILPPQPYDQFCKLLATITESRAVRPMSARCAHVQL